MTDKKKPGPSQNSPEKEEGGDEEKKSEAGLPDLKADKLASPEGIIMMSIAGFFDALSFFDFIPLIGNVIEVISDIIATIFFAVWMIATSRKGWWKLGLAAFIEFIPYLDNIAIIVNIFTVIFGIKLPTSWIGFVYSVL